MTPSPVDWQVVCLEDVATTFSGGTPSRENPAFFGGGIPWVKSGEVNLRRVRRTEETISEDALNKSSARVAPKESVLVAMYGATAGKVAWLEIEAAINQAILAVLAKNGLADGRFLFHALEGEAPAILRKLQGSGQPNLSGTILREHRIALPPLSEQQTIAAILSSVDEATEATQAVIDQLRVMKKAMMAELLTRGPPGRHTRFKMTEIGEVPEEWEVAPLDTIAKTGSGGTPSRGDPANYGGGIPWVKSGEVDNHWILQVAETISQRGLESSAAKWVERGSVLVAMYGATAGKVGRLGIPATTNQAVCAVQTSTDRMSNDFLYWVLLSSTPKLLRSVQGSGQPNLNAGMIRVLPVPVPTLHEQEAIAGMLESLSARLSAESEALRGHTKLKAALMSVLLTGEVRVTPDEDAG